MVQYVSFGNFNSNHGNIQNSDTALILIVMHHTNSYISINSCNTLGSFRMRSFLPGFSILVTSFTVLKGNFSILIKSQNPKMPLENCKKCN